MTTKVEPPATVEFDTAATGAHADGWVERKADVVFKAGKYSFPEKDGGPFEMTPDEIKAFSASFKAPVPLVDTHHDSVFNTLPGRLGELVAVEPSPDFSSFGGRFRVPAWLHGLFKDAPLKLSATWDRATKALKNVALVPNPRVPEAVMFAAFAAAEAEEEEEGKKVGPGKAKERHVSPHGQKFHQFIHDMAAHQGAVCKPEHSAGAQSAEMAALDETLEAARKQAAFHAPHEVEAVQKIHDLALGSGAACALYKENAKHKLKAYQPGNYYAGGAASMPAYRDYQPGNYALMSDEDAAREGKAATERERELQTKLAAAEEARFSAEGKAAAAEAKLREAAVKAAAAEAVAFAQSFGGRLSPAERQDAVFAYQEAAESDRLVGGEVHFSDDAGKASKGSRVAALQARYARLVAGRPNRHVDQVQGGDGARFALAQNKDAADAEKDAGKEAEESATAYAARKNKQREDARPAAGKNGK